MQPAGARLASKASAAGLAFGDEAFRSLAEADVEPSEVFFHKYYSLAAQRSKPVKKIKRKAGSDDEDADESDGSSDSEADMGAQPTHVLNSRQEFVHLLWKGTVDVS